MLWDTSKGANLARLIQVPWHVFNDPHDDTRNPQLQAFGRSPSGSVKLRLGRLAQPQVK